MFSASEEQWNDWRWHFRNRITTVEDLVKYVPLTSQEQQQVQLVSRKYPFSITPYYLSLIDFSDPDDPVRKQALPSIQEIALADFGEDDPLDEKDDSPVPGIVHRYPDRALFVITDICPLLCRHCTRKREWEDGNWVRPKPAIAAMIDYIRRTPSIRDVIISGGDPLTLATERLEEIVAELRSIKHLEIIRFGTRYPVVLPQRIDDEFCDMVSKYGPIWVNTHFNHPSELTPEAARATDKLLRAGVPINNQCVLLRGINDTVETQLKLVHGLMRIKVRPYYLYHADNVKGTEHLRTPVETGIKIIEGLRGHTSGLAVPTFVVDVPGGGGKIPLQPNYALSVTEDEWILRNFEGNIFRYRNPKPHLIPSAKKNGRNGQAVAAKNGNGHTNGHSNGNGHANGGGKNPIQTLLANGPKPSGLLAPDMRRLNRRKERNANRDSVRSEAAGAKNAQPS